MKLCKHDSYVNRINTGEGIERGILIKYIYLLNHEAHLHCKGVRHSLLNIIVCN